VARSGLTTGGLPLIWNPHYAQGAATSGWLEDLDGFTPIWSSDPVWPLSAVACGPAIPASSTAGPRPSVPPRHRDHRHQPAERRRWTLDPYDENESPTVRHLCNLFDRGGPPTSAAPMLAESWTLGRRGDLGLPPPARGVVFHQRRPLHGRRRGLLHSPGDQLEGSEISGDVATFASAEALDDLTVRITTRAADPILLKPPDRRPDHGQGSIGGGWWPSTARVVVRSPQNGHRSLPLPPSGAARSTSPSTPSRPWRGEPDIQHVRFPSARHGSDADGRPCSRRVAPGHRCARVRASARRQQPDLPADSAPESAPSTSASTAGGMRARGCRLAAQSFPRPPRAPRRSTSPNQRAGDRRNRVMNGSRAGGPASSRTRSRL